MAGDESSKLRSLIQRAIMLSDEERRAFLDEVCENDLSLRKRVEEVLDSIDDPLTAINSSSYGWGLPAEGSRIGKYTVIEKLGGGGMGVVYRAEDTRLKRQVALKFLAPELTRDTDARDRFVQEAQAASALDHTNICTVYEVDETAQGLTYIAMACYEGETLIKRMEAGTLPLDKAIDFATQIGKGLAKTHAKGIVHRDIKPANIMIVRDGDHETIKILDFGLAKVAEVSITRTGSTLGTVAYMSPEQARGASVDHRSDIWSLGVVLYEMLTGKRPYGGAFEQAIIYSLLHEEHEPLTDYRSDIPDHWNAIIDKALTREPEERYQTIDSFLEALSERKAPEVFSSARDRPSYDLSADKPRTRLVVAIAGLLIIAATAILMGRTVFDRESTLVIPATQQQLTFTGKAYYPALSPDGQLMAYYQLESDSIGSILVQEVRGGRPIEVLSNVKITDGWFDPIIWSHDGTTLAVNADVGGITGLHLLPRLGGDVRTYRTGSLSMYAAISPDGSQVCVLHEGSKRLLFVDTSTMQSKAVPLQHASGFSFGIDWSPDSDRLVMGTHENYSIFKLWSMRTDGSDVHLILEDSTSLFSPRWGDEGKSVYYLREVNEMELWNVQVSPKTGKQKGRPRLLQRGLQQGTQFSLSRETSKILYYSNTAYRNLWRMSLKDYNEGDPGTRVKLTEGTAMMVSPRVSPDGRQVAFVMQTPSGSYVHTVPLDGGQTQRQATVPSTDWGVTWSSDSRQLAFGVEGGHLPQIGRIDLQSGKTKVFENTQFSESGVISWHPRREILYHLPGNRNFNFLDPETESERPLVTNDSVGWMFNPKYSPDGNTLVVYWNRSPARGLWTLSMVDSSQKNIYSFDSFTDALWPLRWSKDGQWIYATYIDRYPQEIVKVAADGSGIHNVSSIPGTGNYDVDITPDEKYIVVSVPERQSDIWLMEDFDTP